MCLRNVLITLSNPRGEGHGHKPTNYRVVFFFTILRVLKSLKPEVLKVGLTSTLNITFQTNRVRPELFLANQPPYWKPSTTWKRKKQEVTGSLGKYDMDIDMAARRSELLRECRKIIARVSPANEWNIFHYNRNFASPSYHEILFIT